MEQGAPTILYVIQIHHAIEQVGTLIKLLDAPTNSFIINLDPTLNVDRAALEETLSASASGKVLVRRGAPLTWAGISQVHCWIDVFEFALNCRRDWKYIINLSGECLPLTCQATIWNFLEQQSQAGRRAHMWFYTSKLPHDTFRIAKLGDRDALDFAYKTEMFSNRVAALMQEDSAQQFADRKTDLLWEWDLRGALHVTDLVLEKKLVFRNLYPFEAESRRRLIAKLPISGGRAWYVLRRDALEDILSDPILPDVVAMIEHYLSSDELFMQTLISNSKKFPREQIGRKNLHFRQGDPVWVVDSMSEEILSSEAFFARKVWYDRCPALLARVKSLVEAG